MPPSQLPPDRKTRTTRRPGYRRVNVADCRGNGLLKGPRPGNSAAKIMRGGFCSPPRPRPPNNTSSKSCEYCVVRTWKHVDGKFAALISASPLKQTVRPARAAACIRRNQQDSRYFCGGQPVRRKMNRRRGAMMKKRIFVAPNFAFVGYSQLRRQRNTGGAERVPNRGPTPEGIEARPRSGRSDPAALAPGRVRPL